MNWELVSLDATVPQPWRNGGGLTRELLAWPGAADWKVRMSVADVRQDGPFSRYEGIERWFAVLEGPGVELRIGGGVQRLDAGSEPFRFDGGMPVGCSLVHGPTRDFNLMAPAGRARLRRVQEGGVVRTRAAALLALYAHGAASSILFGDQLVEVPARHLAWCLVGTGVSGTIDGGDALWIEVYE